MAAASFAGSQPGAIWVAAALIVLCLAGLVTAGRLLFGPGPRPMRIPPWTGAESQVLLLLLLVYLGASGMPALADLALRRTGLGPVDRQVWDTLAQELGMLLGIAIYLQAGRNARLVRPDGPPAPLRTARSGLITFLVVLPAVFAVTFFWQWVLGWFGFEARLQDVADLFQEIHTPGTRLVFVLITVVLAPVAEEYVFRAGIFRYLRSRIPRRWAIFISAVAFGAVHLIPSPADGLTAFVPLIFLGAMFAVAYERTGRIGTTIVAHALFNLTSLTAISFGVGS